jgi:hypothetical protein
MTALVLDIVTFALCCARALLMQNTNALRSLVVFHLADDGARRLSIVHDPDLSQNHARTAARCAFPRGCPH